MLWCHVYMSGHSARGLKLKQTTWTAESWKTGVSIIPWGKYLHLSRKIHVGRKRIPHNGALSMRDAGAVL